MNRFLKTALVLIGTLILQHAVYSAPIPNTDNHPQSFLGPTLKARFTNRLVEDKAYSLAGEAGSGNMRLAATYAWKFSECNRLKISAEYLWQDITFPFFSGNSTEWLNQGAVGFAYQYDFAANRLYPQFNLSAYSSHVPSRSLGNMDGFYINTSGASVQFSDARRDAGSNAYGFSPGLAFTPWQGSRVGLTLNYDKVYYNTKYVINNENHGGFGGTLDFNQAVSNYLGVGASASVREPFNYYLVNVSFARIPYLASWTVGLFANYVDGKHTMPNTYNLGVTANYFLDQSLDDNTVGCPSPLSDRMLAFTATPAVYMPQVIAVPDGVTTFS